VEDDTVIVNPRKRKVEELFGSAEQSGIIFLILMSGEKLTVKGSRFLYIGSKSDNEIDAIDAELNVVDDEEAPQPTNASNTNDVGNIIGRHRPVK